MKRLFIAIYNLFILFNCQSQQLDKSRLYHLSDSLCGSSTQLLILKSNCLEGFYTMCLNIDEKKYDNLTIKIDQMLASLETQNLLNISVNDTLIWFTDLKNIRVAKNNQFNINKSIIFFLQR